MYVDVEIVFNGCGAQQHKSHAIALYLVRLFVEEEFRYCPYYKYNSMEFASADRVHVDMLYASVTWGHEIGAFFDLPVQAAPSSGEHIENRSSENVKVLENAVDDFFARSASRKPSS